MTSIDHESIYYLYVDSINRVSGTVGNFNYNITLPQGIAFNKVVVLNCTIPKTYYLIQAGYNTFTLRELSVNTIITIPAGNYSFNTWKTTITNLLNTNSPNL